MFSIQLRGKRLIIMVLALALAILAAGCGGETKETGSQPQTADEADVDLAGLLAKAQELPGMTYDAVTTVNGEETSEVKYAVKLPRIRIETGGPEIGMKMVCIIDTKEEVVYALSPDQQTATKMPLAQFEVDTATPQDYSQSLDPDSLKYIKTETLDGKECLVYEIAEPDSTGKVWLWKDYGIPLRIEFTYEGELVVNEYKNVQVTEPDDSLFELPAKVTDLGDLDFSEAAS
ncbi:MAG: outer membrane lipoprotein carrier protein LolA [Syntrophomonadaceae bacterium]|nr:outer membrane lipoprotein carrier protein LolA [Syntrophomonadaceae bacterium]